MKIRIEMEVPNDKDLSEILEDCQEMVCDYFEENSDDYLTDVSLVTW